MERIWRKNKALTSVVLLMALIAGLVVWYSLAGSDDESPPVIIYLVDTLRADRLGAYGYPVPTSPTIDELASDSVLFEQVYAPAPWTVPSVASMNTSSFLCEHGLLSERHQLDPKIKTLPQRLTDAGYLTLGRVQQGMAGAMTGLDRGFSIFKESTNPWAKIGSSVETLLERSWDGEALYLYIHTNEPHDPYWTPREFQRNFGHFSIDKLVAYNKTYRLYRRLTGEHWTKQQPLGTVDNSAGQQAEASKLEALNADISLLYDASVQWADSNLADVIRRLKRIGLWDKAIFIFLSDHGEEFGEHGGWFHEQSVYEEQLRVPLIIHFPDTAHAGLRIDAPVSLLDIMPTIFDFIGKRDFCSDCRGQSLLPLISGEKYTRTADPTVFAVRDDVRNFHKQWSKTRGNKNVVLRIGDRKLIWNIESDQFEFYDLSSDPEEKNNLAFAQDHSAKQIREKIKIWWNDCVANGYRFLSPEDMDQEKIDKLRSLGYL